MHCRYCCLLCYATAPMLLFCCCSSIYLLSIQDVLAVSIPLKDDAAVKEYLLQPHRRAELLQSQGATVSSIRGALALEPLLGSRTFVCLHYKVGAGGTLQACTGAGGTQQPCPGVDCSLQPCPADPPALPDAAIGTSNPVWYVHSPQGTRS